MTAAELLGRYGVEAQDALPDLVALARLRPNWPHYLALHVAAIGQPAVSAMADAIGDHDRNVRKLAAHALERLGPAARSAEPAIMSAFWEADLEDLQDLKRTIAAIGLSRQAVSEFLAKVKNPDAESVKRPLPLYRSLSNDFRTTGCTFANPRPSPWAGSDQPLVQRNLR